MFLQIPFGLVADFLLYQLIPTLPQVAGTLLIIIGFFCLNFDDKLTRCFQNICKNRDKSNRM